MENLILLELLERLKSESNIPNQKPSLINTDLAGFRILGDYFTLNKKNIESYSNLKGVQLIFDDKDNFINLLYTQNQNDSFKEITLFNKNDIHQISKCDGSTLYLSKQDLEKEFKNEILIDKCVEIKNTLFETFQLLEISFLHLINAIEKPDEDQLEYNLINGMRVERKLSKSDRSFYNFRSHHLVQSIRYTLNEIKKNLNEYISIPENIIVNYIYKINNIPISTEESKIIIENKNYYLFSINVGNPEIMLYFTLIDKNNNHQEIPLEEFIKKYGKKPICQIITDTINNNMFTLYELFPEMLRLRELIKLYPLTNYVNLITNLLLKTKTDQSHKTLMTIEGLSEFRKKYDNMNKTQKTDYKCITNESHVKTYHHCWFTINIENYKILEINNSKLMSDELNFTNNLILTKYLNGIMTKEGYNMGLIPKEVLKNTLFKLDENGYRHKSRELKWRSENTKKYSQILGFRINLDNSKQIIEPITSTLNKSYFLIDDMDIEEIVNGGIETASVNIIPNGKEDDIASISEVELSNEKVKNTGLAETLYRTDAELKYFAFGGDNRVEASFEQVELKKNKTIRSIHHPDSAYNPKILPFELKGLSNHVDDVVFATIGSNDSIKGKFANIYVKSFEIAIEKKDNSYEIYFANPDVAVHGGVILKNNKELSHEEARKEFGQDFDGGFLDLMTKYYFQLGMIYPEFLRLVELCKLMTMSKIIHVLAYQLEGKNLNGNNPIVPINEINNKKELYSRLKEKYNWIETPLSYKIFTSLFEKRNMYKIGNIPSPDFIGIHRDKPLVFGGIDLITVTKNFSSSGKSYINELNRIANSSTLMYGTNIMPLEPFQPYRYDINVGYKNVGFDSSSGDFWLQNELYQAQEKARKAIWENEKKKLNQSCVFLKSNDMFNFNPINNISPILNLPSPNLPSPNLLSPNLPNPNLPSTNLPNPNLPNPHVPINSIIANKENKEDKKDPIKLPSNINSYQELPPLISTPISEMPVNMAKNILTGTMASSTRIYRTKNEELQELYHRLWEGECKSYSNAITYQYLNDITSATSTLMDVATIMNPGVKLVQNTIFKVVRGILPFVDKFIETKTIPNANEEYNRCVLETKFLIEKTKEDITYWGNVINSVRSEAYRNNIIIEDNEIEKLIQIQLIDDIYNK